MTNSLDEVSRLPLFLEEIAEETGMGMAEMMSLNVALEEALVNVIHYAYPQMEEGKIVLTSAWDEQSRTHTFRSAGKYLWCQSSSGIYHRQRHHPWTPHPFSGDRE